jgi:hypothetical protein
MSYLDLAKRVMGEAAGKGATGIDAARKLTAGDCADLLLDAQPVIEAGYRVGALPWVAAHAPELLDALHATEAALDALAGTTPEARDFCAALDRYTAAWAAISDAFAARQERHA